MDPRAAEWFGSATSAGTQWSSDELIRIKGAHRISVVIPARDEASTIGDIIDGVRKELVEAAPLVDELIVIDSDSTDDTGTIAVEAGASVYAARAIRPDLGSYSGKGEALWKSQFVATGDVLVFIDGDLTQWGPHFVVGLLGPLLSNPRVELVKGFYDRVLDDGSGQQAPQGGRVTELVARPLLNLCWPELSSVVQPLAGEWAIRTSTFGALPVPIGYGVEMATLLDVLARSGLEAIAQVDLGQRAHSHQSVHDLAVMAAEIIAVVARRIDVPTGAAQLWQFDRSEDPPWRSRDVPMVERAPALSLPPRLDQ